MTVWNIREMVCDMRKAVRNKNRNLQDGLDQGPKKYLVGVGIVFNDFFNILIAEKITIVGIKMAKD